MLSTFPSLTMISFGPQPQLTLIPSSVASSISSSEAGMCSLSSRQNIDTLTSPQRLLFLATSMATLPPPITTTSPSIGYSSLSFTSLKKSTAVITPSASSPGIPAFLPP